MQRIYCSADIIKKLLLPFWEIFTLFFLRFIVHHTHTHTHTPVYPYFVKGVHVRINHSENMQQIPSSSITDTNQESTAHSLYPSQPAPPSSLASIPGGVDTPTPQGFHSPLQADDDSEEDDTASKDIPNHKRNGRRKIKIEYIEDRSRRHITFSKRKAGIMKKVQTTVSCCLCQHAYPCIDHCIGL